MYVDTHISLPGPYVPHSHILCVPFLSRHITFLLQSLRYILKEKNNVFVIDSTTLALPLLFNLHFSQTMLCFVLIKHLQWV